MHKMCMVKCVWASTDVTIFDVPQYKLTGSATAEIARVGGHYAVQGHLGSLMLVPIESPYITSYCRIILTYILSRTIFQLLRSNLLVKLSPLTRGCLPLIHSFSVTSAISAIHRNYTSLKTRFFVLDFLSQTVWFYSCNQFDLAFKCGTFSVTTQNNGHYAVQGHSKSQILIPMESPYATSY